MASNRTTYDKEYFFVMDFFNTGKPEDVRVGRKDDQYYIYFKPGPSRPQYSIRKNENGEWYGYSGRMLLEDHIKAIGEQIDRIDGSGKI